MTYNVELTAKPDSRGIHHVMIRLHSKGQLPARIQTSIEILPKHWNPEKDWGKWVRKSHQHQADMNNKIMSAYNQVKEVVESYLKLDPLLTPKRAKERYEASSMNRLVDFLPTIFDQTNLSSQTRSARLYQYNYFIRWAGEEICIEQITPDLINRFKQHLLSIDKMPATINTYISNLRVLYERVQRLRNIPKKESIAASPFLEWENIIVKQARKGRLSLETIHVLQEKPFNLAFKRVSGKQLYQRPTDWARWCWLACNLQAGMRIGDLIRSRYGWYETDSEGKPIRLRYQMQKNGKWISIPVSKPLQKHLDWVWQTGKQKEDYLLPFLRPDEPFFKYVTRQQIHGMPAGDYWRLKTRVNAVTCQLNRWLKEMCEEFGIQLPDGVSLTNHTARHSFADKVRLAIKHGKTDAKGRVVTNFDAKELLGHTDMKTTEMYFGDMDQEWLDSAMDALSEDG
ncbi:tyrosine-type recombinase/integrase [Spirosoma sp. BT702]|uniref:Tyrosine-type recombinase/integrase n=1 Tax=Spirosoma profusum TaxID=2771354 RepID=A0A926Y295_9BACT|nr:phage integrase SAM-like domain-containing protein [Spirosoma profusum]MBD2700775.1 tyrosine-type recombinase/integrase [Spirosoma profusum]